MAKIGILGTRMVGDIVDTSKDIKDPVNGSSEYIFRLVYKVPTDVKMAVIDLDARLETGNSANNPWLAFDIKKESDTYMNAVVLIVGPDVFVDTGYKNLVYTRKCLVLGPGDCVYFRGTADSSGVVTGIEHA